MQPQSITALFCAIGNPLNDGTRTYTWENGRQLKQMQSVDTTAAFVYNENGLRVQKTVNGVVTKYTLHGKNVVHMTKGSDELHFFYDAQNRPAVVVYNGTAYAYVKNLQGDIIAILDSTGTAVVSYTYDAWGTPTGTTGSMATTLGVLNPFRYRGYVYDEETQLYYLRSRYYTPTLCRFVNADGIAGKHRPFSHNLYLYCRNHIVTRKDTNGFEETWVQDTEISIFDIIPELVYIEQTPQPRYENGHYYVITPIEETVSVWLIDSGELGATAYRTNTRSGKPEYYVGLYQDGDFYFYCEDIYGYSDADYYEMIIETEETFYRYGWATLSLSHPKHKKFLTIQNLQEDLMNLGYSIGSDSLGYFGIGTYYALKSFQSVNGLTSDGEAGKDTKPVLFSEADNHPVW